MRLKRIAEVENGIDEDVDDWNTVESRLVFDTEFVPGLYKLSNFRRIWVIFGFHRRRGWAAMVRPMHDQSRPLVGVFSTRSPNRPNRVGLTLVDLISVEGNIVRVKGLDAFHGSPVFDIKPYEKEISRDSWDGQEK